MKRPGDGRLPNTSSVEMDFAFDGTGPAKLYEYNADTPTSLYETAVFQWVWLEQAVERGFVTHVDPREVMPRVVEYTGQRLQVARIR